MSKKKYPIYKIVMAEDDEFISRAYKDGLSRAGFEVILAKDGLQAIDCIRREKPDLVLLDIVMPMKNGFEVLAEIKADAAIKNIPVIILSNLGQDSDVAKGKELGADDYFIKSNFLISEIVEKINVYLEQKKRQSNDSGAQQEIL